MNSFVLYFTKYLSVMEWKEVKTGPSPEMARETLPLIATAKSRVDTGDFVLNNPPGAS